jgi:hypothetical protein
VVLGDKMTEDEMKSLILDFHCPSLCLFTQEYSIHASALGTERVVGTAVEPVRMGMGGRDRRPGLFLPFIPGVQALLFLWSRS